MRVSLVGTVHAERGTVTVDALVEILVRAAPCVVFAEIPDSYIARYKDGSHGTLESRAAARYAEMEAVDIIPVDAAEPRKEVSDNDKHLFTLIERTSPEYRRLIDMHTAETLAGGFAYLNSTRCLDTWAAIYQEAADTVKWLRDPHVRVLFEDWIRVVEHRDNTMLSGILEYGARTGIRDGMLLVGTSHRRSLIERASAFGDLRPLPLEWDLSSFLARSA